MIRYKLLFAFLLFSLNSFSQESSINNDSYVAEDSVVINTKDGGTICMLVIRNNNIKQPCILWYDIYADSSLALKEGGKAIAAMSGYAFVMANTRGKKCSINDINPFEKDADDAYYIIDWISKQPWCNGKVGMTGGSYLGFSQWATVKHLHPSLKTIVPQVSVGAGIDYPMQNGVFMSYMLRWIHFVTNNKLTDFKTFVDTTSWNATLRKWYSGGYSFGSLDSLEGKPNKIFRRWLSHPLYDDYWKKMTPQQSEFSKINIPILTITGYWDDDQLGAMYYYNQFKKYNPNGEHYLLIGPYDHSNAQGYVKDTILGLVTDSAAKNYTAEMVFKWFDYILKDSSKPELIKDKVNFEMTGENKWYHVSSLEKMSNDSLKFYLDDGKLIQTKPSFVKYHSQQVDLKKRDFIKLSGEDLAAFPTIVMDSIVKNPDILYYYTKPLEKDLLLSGNFTSDLTFMINKKDVDFVLDLYEQTSDGKIIGLSETMQRASMIQDKSVRHLLQPSKLLHLKIDNTFIMCKKINKGSRLVFGIGVNNSPAWQINYGTGGDVSREDIKDAKTPFVIKWSNESAVTFKIIK